MHPALLAFGSMTRRDDFQRDEGFSGAGGNPTPVLATDLNATLNKCQTDGADRLLRVNDA